MRPSSSLLPMMPGPPSLGRDPPAMSRRVVGPVPAPGLGPGGVMRLAGLSLMIVQAKVSGRGTHAPSSAAVQRAIQVYRRADQGQVGEGLREVPQRLTRGTNLLGVEPQVVGVGEHLLEDGPGLLDPSRPGERLDVPERAEVE